MKETSAPSAPFAAFRAGVQPQTPLRTAITAAYRRPETDCLPPLLALAELPPEDAARAANIARDLVARLRGKAHAGPIEDLMQEYALSSREGVALMCLAEALLRIPDNATRDALIRDKIASGDWRGHVGHSPSMFVNAATWGLVVTGRLTATTSETSLSTALTRLVARSGEPIIRRAVDLAMRLLGEQFVAGQTIDQAIAQARSREARGFRYSYDMLGEAAMTEDAAARYLGSYQNAIQAIGQAAAGRGVIDGPGISVKLSALHPCYQRTKRERVLTELLSRLKGLAVAARAADIGLNIDAEEADRLELSLDLLEALAFDPELAGWNGLGFVVQAYGKRAPFVIDWLIDLARRAGRRLMVRLVKGAYWDSEIKRAQVDGLADFPVYTRKVHTDVCYLACARKLLGATDAVFPQFATHNAQTLAAVMQMAGDGFQPGQYEFQCLHGMGEPLYEEVVGPHKLGRPCRIYAPVGTHETLLAYLVRRLLENGANSSFVNRVADPAVPVAQLVADPVAAARAVVPVGGPHPRIVLPPDLYGPGRRNSAGLDLTDESRLASLGAALAESVRREWTAGTAAVWTREIRNPADRRDIVGRVHDATPDEGEAGLASAVLGAPAWAARSAAERALCLRQAADRMETVMPVLIGLIVREAGKSFANAIAEVREAVDFLRYYATEAERLLTGDPPGALGTVVCISPWNFPLSIFTGQVAAALAAGNAVLAKPAEETPLIAAEAVRILWQAGVPSEVLHLLPGYGSVGAALVADPRVQGVMFTGSTSVARLIQRQLAERLTVDGRPVPLIAETGGQNAMIVDSSALAEQVVADVIASAFDSAGQRCSALRILCLQDDSADTVLDMLKGAMRELETGNPHRLPVDVGPVITAEARDGILTHIEAMRARGHAVTAASLSPEAACGTFVAPTLIEIGKVADVEREVFGPVLHVLRYRRGQLDQLIEEINATGYGLTFGLHTRIDETIARVLQRIEAGNIYVNRNIIGATVGVQPFGGCGLSGTGPKAGGPLYLTHLLRGPPPGALPPRTGRAPAAARAYVEWLRARGQDAVADRCLCFLSRSALEASLTMAGPVGESNVYGLRPRGSVAALGGTEAAVLTQVGAILATGNSVVLEAGGLLTGLPREVAACVTTVANIDEVGDLRAVLFEGGRDALIALNRRIAAREGAIVQVQVGGDYDLDRLLAEQSVATNTAAAGGNAALLAIKDPQTGT
jgi:RHH-type proline utilization regulon transcriptional repressor/proline dehydrogenase/delta 1-pyrroline-5-carboxylate dehydrogenase